MRFAKRRLSAVEVAERQPDLAEYAAGVALGVAAHHHQFLAGSTHLDLGIVELSAHGQDFAAVQPAQRWITGRIGNEEMPVYQATDPEAIREHARRVAMPADAITPVVDTVIVRPDPTNV